MTNFNSIKFNPATKTLSINGENNNLLHSFDLTTTAVKLKVTRVDGQLKVAIQTGSVGSFSSYLYELKLKFSGVAHYTSILFGHPSATLSVEIDNDSATLCDTEEFYALFVGSDDIRNNRTATQMMLMEGETISIEIDTTADMVIARYHDNITANV